jgi:hypothetical protein
VTLQKYFSHPSLVVYFLPTPTKTGTAMGGRLQIATHLYQANYLANQQQLLDFAAPFTSLSKQCKMLGQKTILLSQTDMF